MRYKLMLSALAVAVMAYAAVAAPIGSPGGFDPGAARKDLSNVDPATGRTALDAEQAGVAAAHVASTGTDVHGLGTMAIATATDYVATDTFTAHTGNTSNPHGVTYEQVGAEQLGAVATHDALTAAHGVAEVAGIEDIPNNASFTLAGLGTKPFSALTDKPTTLSGYGITDAASADALTAHVASTGTTVHGMGTMASEAKADYVATSTLTAHTGNTANPHSVTYEQVGAEASGAVATHDALTAVHGVAEVAGIEDIPNNASFTLAGLSTKPFSALTDTPTTLTGYGITDAALDASLTAHIGNTSNPHSVTYSQLSDKPTFGTMASETATNYVATSTLTAHESDTSTHGKTTLAGMEDIDDLSGVTDAATARTTLGVAASSSTVLTSGANAMTGSLKFSGNYGVLQSTSDGADTGSILGSGGGYTSGNLYDRGAAWILYGNEYTTIGGQARYYAGNVSTGDHIFYTGAGTERFHIAYGGTLSSNGKFYAYNSTAEAMKIYGYSSDVTSGNASVYNGELLLGRDAAYQGRISYGGGTSGQENLYITNTYNHSNGGIVFRVNAAGTPKDAMKVSGGARVLLRTTTDDGVNALQVNGSVAISTFAQLASPTAIPTAAAGRIYFNGTEQKFKKCLNGSTWVDM